MRLNCCTEWSVFPLDAAGLWDNGKGNGGGAAGGSKWNSTAHVWGGPLENSSSDLVNRDNSKSPKRMVSGLQNLFF